MLRTLLFRILSKRKQIGTLGLIKFAVKRVWGTAPSRRDVSAFYRFILPTPFGDAPVNAAPRTVNWVIPNFSIGSGGHLNIFRMIANLEKQGFLCRIIIVEDSHYITSAQAKADICKHFVPVQAEVSVGRKSMKPAAITVATSWETAYAVRDFRGSHYKCYFVQDFEPFFFAPGSQYSFAEDTYRFGFYGITAGKWLTDKLSSEYGMRCDWFGFSYDKNLYTAQLPKPVMPEKTVFFYARPVTERRGFELGMLVLHEVSKRMPEAKFLLAGWDTSEYVIPFPYENLGVVALDQLSSLYNQCDAALVLSFTNLSLLPLELMAAGCPVVSNTGPNAEWALNANNAVLAQPTVTALADALVALLQDDPRRARLAEQALYYVQATDWEAEAGKVAAVFWGLINGDK